MNKLFSDDAWNDYFKDHY